MPVRSDGRSDRLLKQMLAGPYSGRAPEFGPSFDNRFPRGWRGSGGWQHGLGAAL